MDRATENDTRPATAQSAPTLTDDPLLRLLYQSAPPTGPEAIRCVQYPGEMDLRGIPVICLGCRANRDWLLINQSRHVWITCRCGKQWLEPELTRADFDALVDIPEVARYPNLRAGLVALGFDGAFAGAYIG